MKKIIITIGLIILAFSSFGQVVRPGTYWNGRVLFDLNMAGYDIINVDSVTSDTITLAGFVKFTEDVIYQDAYWDDLTFPATTSKRGVNDRPDFDFTNIGLLFPYADTAEITYHIAQFPHGFIGGNLYPHVHYIQGGENDTAEFVMYYRWVDMGDTTTAFTRIETTDCTIFPYTSGNLHQLAAFPAVDGTAKTYSSVLSVRLFRKYQTGYNGDVLMKDFDIHYPISRPGSDNPYN